MIAYHEVTHMLISFPLPSSLLSSTLASFAIDRNAMCSDKLGQQTNPIGQLFFTRLWLKFNVRVPKKCSVLSQKPRFCDAVINLDREGSLRKTTLIRVCGCVSETVSESARNDFG